MRRGGDGEVCDPDDLLAPPRLPSSSRRGGGGVRVPAGRCAEDALRGRRVREDTGDGAAAEEAALLLGFLWTLIESVSLGR
ncbi:Auxin responsive protein [Musa troglodytarum]|uniref:Auxin responsive protein n=1 Tax=Musa troglodytarum TaxID=320322 RepID=A0A9E7G447_9LILI|nr:Auxin responsive protein [Musa troglodytarum]